MMSNSISQEEIIINLLKDDPLLSNTDYRVNHSFINYNEEQNMENFNNTISKEFIIEENSNPTPNSPMMSSDLTSEDEAVVPSEFDFSPSAKYVANSILEFNVFVKVAQQKTSYDSNILLFGKEIKNNEMTILSTKSRDSDSSPEKKEIDWSNLMEESKIQFPYLSISIKAPSKIKIVEKKRYPFIYKKEKTQSENKLQLINQTQKKVEYISAYSICQKILDSPHYSIQSNFSYITFGKPKNVIQNNYPFEDEVNENKKIPFFHNAFINEPVQSFCNEGIYLASEDTPENKSFIPIMQNKFLTLGDV